MTSALAISRWFGWSANELRHGRPMRDESGHADASPTPTPTPAPAPTGEADPAPEVTDTPPGPDPLDGDTLLGGGEPAPKPEGEGGEEGGEQGGEGDAEPAVLGAPEAYELQLPEGITLDTEAFTEAEPVLRELNLSNDAANKLAPIAAKLVERGASGVRTAIVNEVVEQRKAWAETALADPEIGGTPQRFEESKVFAAKALDTLGFKDGDPFRLFLNETGLGNHPEMIRAMVRVGKAVAEPGDLPRPGAVQQERSDGQKFYGDTYNRKDQ